MQQIPAFKETEIGAIPIEWDMVVFEELCVLRRGQDLRKEDFKKGEYEVAGSNGVIGFHNTFNYHAPGVTVGRSGSCGSVHYYEKNFWAHNTSLVVRDFKNNYPLFIYYKLIHLNLKRYASGVSVPTLNRNSFSNILITFPPYSEQQNIADTLSLIESAIQKQEQIINTTTELKNALMKKLFTEGLNNEPTKETEIGLVPNTWEVKPLKEICEKPTYGYTDSASTNGNVKFLRITDITEDGVDWDGVPFCNCPEIKMNNYLLKENDIVCLQGLVPQQGKVISSKIHLKLFMHHTLFV